MKINILDKGKKYLQEKSINELTFGITFRRCWAGDIPQPWVEKGFPEYVENHNIHTFENYKIAVDKKTEDYLKKNNKNITIEIDLLGIIFKKLGVKRVY